MTSTSTQQRSLCDTLDELDRLGLDDLGALHVMARDALARVQEALAKEMRRARERGMPVLEITHRSGYASQTTVIKIIKPGYRDDQNRKDRNRRVSAADA